MVVGAAVLVVGGTVTGAIVVGANVVVGASVVGAGVVGDSTVVLDTTGVVPPKIVPLLPPWPLLHADATSDSASNAAAEADVWSLITGKVCRVRAEPRRRPDDESTPNRCRTRHFRQVKSALYGTISLAKLGG